MKTPPPDKPFDPDDPNFDPWADDPNAPKEPGLEEDDYDLPWDEEADDEESAEFPLDEDAPTPSPVPQPFAPPRGPAALLDSELRGEIEFEILFQQTKTEFLKAPPLEPPASRQVILLPLLLALIVWGATQQGVFGALAILGTLVLHNLGHFIGQWLGGYRETDLRFSLVLNGWLPKQTTAPASRRAVTMLLGPLPGLVLAFGLLALHPAGGGPLEFFAIILFGFNLSELWPDGRSDGGKLFEIIPFLRPPWVGTLARAVVIALLAVLVVWLQNFWLQLFIGMMIVFLILDCLRSHRLARSRFALANVFPKIAERPADIPDATLRHLFSVTLSLEPTDYDPEYLARVMHNLHEQAHVPALARPSAIALVVAYAFGWLLAAGCFALLFAHAEEREAARTELLAAFDRAIVANANEWPMASRECVAKWQAAEPSVRREAWTLVEKWKSNPPPKPQTLLDFADELK